MTKDKEPGDYEVGYKKPPVANRFQKGQSGNPKGKEKMTKNLDTIKRDALFEPIEIQQNGRTMTVPAIQAILLKMRNNALAGDYRAGVHAIHLAAQLAGLAEADQANTKGPEHDLPTMHALLRDYLEHAVPPPNDKGDECSGEMDDNTSEKLDDKGKR